MWGLSDIVDSVSDFVDDVGDVASDVVDVGATIAHGAVDVTSFVGDLVDYTNPLSYALKAVGVDLNGSLHTVMDAAVDATSGIARDGIESVEKTIRGTGEILKGNFLGGLEKIGDGLLDSGFYAQTDASIFLGAKAIGAIQQLTGAEGTRRSITAAEKAELQKVYGDSIDYDKITIVEESGIGIMATGTGARTIGNTIYVNSDSLPLSQSLLTHEMCHVWQFQNGSTDYLREALVGQTVGDKYDFEKGIKEGKSFADLNPEQQGDFMRELYLSHFVDDPAGHPFTIGGVDYSAYATEALRQVRNGEGAP